MRTNPRKRQVRRSRRKGRDRLVQKVSVTSRPLKNRYTLMSMRISPLHHHVHQALMLRIISCLSLTNIMSIKSPGFGLCNSLHPFSYSLSLSLLLKIIQMVREGLEQNYPQLQNLIKRDPGSYEQEFRQQYEHFKSAWGLLALGQTNIPHLESMLMFVAHCAPSYHGKSKPSSFTDDLGPLLMSTLEDVDMLAGLEPSLRRSMVQAALLLRKNRMLDSGSSFLHCFGSSGSRINHYVSSFLVP